MIDETDGVQHARRETWAKALAAARNVTGFAMTMPERYAVDMVVAEVTRAARADGVVIGECE